MINSCLITLCFESLDDEVQYVSENGDLVMYSVSSKRKQVLITGLELSVNLVSLKYVLYDYSILIFFKSATTSTMLNLFLFPKLFKNGKLPGKCSLSADRKYVLISYDSQKVSAKN